MASSLVKGRFCGGERATDTTWLTRNAAIAASAGRRTVRHMLTHDQNQPTDTADVFLDTEGLAERYCIGTTKAKELLRSGRLPASVVPGMVRIPLAALRAWELAAALAGTPADPARSSEHVTVVAPPPARSGGRPARKAAA